MVKDYIEFLKSKPEYSSDTAYVKKYAEYIKKAFDIAFCNML